MCYVTLAMLNYKDAAREVESKAYTSTSSNRSSFYKTTNPPAPHIHTHFKSLVSPFPSLNKLFWRPNSLSRTVWVHLSLLMERRKTRPTAKHPWPRSVAQSSTPDQASYKRLLITDTIWDFMV